MSKAAILTAKKWFKIEDKTVHLFVQVKPNARESAIIEIKQQAIHIALRAKPHKGEANKALIEFLAKLLKLPKTQIILKRGENSSYKQIILPLTVSVQQFLNEKEL